MVSKRKSVGTEASPIEVKFIGNESIFWLPQVPALGGSLESSLQSSTSLPTSPPPDNIEISGPPFSNTSSSLHTANDEGLRQQFIVFLRTEIRQLQNCPNNPDAEYAVDNTKKAYSAAEKKCHLALLAVVLDPTAKLAYLSLDEQHRHKRSLSGHFRSVMRIYVNQIHSIFQVWDKGRPAPGTTIYTEAGPEDEEEQEDVDDGGLPSKRRKKGKGKNPVTTTRGRSTADKNAQKLVPTWYKGRCILSNFIEPQGAHIVPVRPLNVQKPSFFWDAVQCFWPLPDIEDLVVGGREVTNILPMSPDAHVLWDKYAFAIRPIEDPSDPQHKMYIQMVWMKDLDTEGGLVSGDWDHDGCGTIVDFRRSENGTYPPVKHGDVYEIVTADPNSRPLPSLRLLQIQYGIHKIFAGMRAAGALKILFSDDPPDDPGPLPSNISVPIEWESLLEAAVKAGVLDVTAASRWGKAIAIFDYYSLPREPESD